MENKTLKSFLDIMEEVFGVRSLKIQNEFLFLEASEINIVSYEMCLSLKFNNNGKKKKLPLEEEKIYFRDKKKLLELKGKMEHLENDCKRVVKEEKEKVEWHKIILTELNEMGVKYDYYQTDAFIIALNRLQKNILALEDYIVYENIDKPNITRIFSYNNLDELLRIIGKEHRKIQLGDIYDK